RGPLTDFSAVVPESRRALSVRRYAGKAAALRGDGKRRRICRRLLCALLGGAEAQRESLLRVRQGQRQGHLRARLPAGDRRALCAQGRTEVRRLRRREHFSQRRLRRKAAVEAADGVQGGGLRMRSLTPLFLLLLPPAFASGQSAASRWVAEDIVAEGE